MGNPERGDKLGLGAQRPVYNVTAVTHRNDPILLVEQVRKLGLTDDIKGKASYDNQNDSRIP
jgi:hypothetical protein